MLPRYQRTVYTSPPAMSHGSSAAPPSSTATRSTEEAAPEPDPEHPVWSAIGDMFRKYIGKQRCRDSVLYKHLLSCLQYDLKLKLNRFLDCANNEHLLQGLFNLF